MNYMIEHFEMSYGIAKNIVHSVILKYVQSNSTYLNHSTFECSDRTWLYNTDTEIDCTRNEVTNVNLRFLCKLQTANELAIAKFSCYLNHLSLYT